MEMKRWCNNKQVSEQKICLLSIWELLYLWGEEKSLFSQPFLAKIRAKFNVWNVSLLYQGGRLTIIKSVLSAMPIYLIQVLNPPKTVLKQIDKIIAKFFWGSTEEGSRKVHLSKWRPLCLPISEGGLGVRNMADMCKAFTVKLWFRFRCQNSLWAKCLIQKYCRKTYPGETLLHSTDSQILEKNARIKTHSSSELLLESREFAISGKMNGMRREYWSL